MFQVILQKNAGNELGDLEKRFPGGTITVANKRVPPRDGNRLEKRKSDIFL